MEGGGPEGEQDFRLFSLRIVCSFVCRLDIVLTSYLWLRTSALLYLLSSDGSITCCLARGFISLISESANVWLLLEARVDQSSRD